MNKKMILAGAATMVILAGCQNLEDQMGAKLAESLINTATNGEVKVTIEDLEQGKMNITTKEGTISLDGNESGGTFKMTDETGKTLVEGSGDGSGVVIRDESGNEVLKADENSMVLTDEDGNSSTFQGGEGAGRPSDVPADMPSPPGATDFNYFTYNQMASLNYQLGGRDLETNCSEIQQMVEGAGWQVSESGFNFQTEDSIAKNYENADYNLVVMCGLQEDGVHIGLQKEAKTK